MPIRINLLAEAQALEESRRRDPVKRTTIGCAALVGAVLLWSIILQLKVIASKADLNSYQARWQSIEEPHKVAVESHRHLMLTEKKLASLERLRTNRFLWGSVLNAFQESMKDMDAIQVTRLKVDQIYNIDPGTPAQTNGPTRIPAVPATASEKIVVTVEASDVSSPPGDQHNRYKASILATPYFKNYLQKTNGVLLTSLSPPQTDTDTGNTYVKFTLQCLFPEKVR